MWVTYASHQYTIHACWSRKWQKTVAFSKGYKNWYTSKYVLISLLLPCLEQDGKFKEKKEEESKDGDDDNVNVPAIDVGAQGNAAVLTAENFFSWGISLL